MTGGAGDYYIPEDQQPVGVRAARDLVSTFTTKWTTTTNKGQVLLFTALVSGSIWAALRLSDAVDMVPVLREALRFVGLVVSGWAFWRCAVGGSRVAEWVGGWVGALFGWWVTGGGFGWWVGVWLCWLMCMMVQEEQHPLG